MRITIYKNEDRTVSILVEAAVGHKKPPVLLPAMPLDKISEELPAVLDYQRGPKPTPQA